MIERILAFASPFLRRNWVTLTLVSLMISTMTYSLDTANWVRDDSPLIQVFLIGVLFGWMLAASYYRGWFVLLYALAISLFASIESLAHVLQPLDYLFTVPFAQTVDQMNLRAFEFSLRVGGWIDTYQNGENIKDTGLFVLILSFILALSAIWWMWATIRQQRALYGLLPLCFLMAVNIHLSRQSLATYMIFLTCVLLQVVRTSFNHLHREWDSRQVDYPEQLGLEWGLSAAAVVLVIVLIARIGPIFGTREGWHAISDWVAETRARTTTVSTRLFSGVNPPPPPPAQPGEKPRIFVNTPNMGEIGAPIAQGEDTIMWVRTSDPPPIPPEVGMNIPGVVARLHYWRNGIYSTYTGRGWEAAPLSGDLTAQPEQIPENPPIGHYYLRQNFEIEAEHSGALFSVNDPLQTSAEVHLRSTTSDSSHMLDGQTSSYQVISEATKVSANQLINASTDYPETIRNAYLQLPDSLPARVRALSKRLTGTAKDPYHKAMQIQKYLRDNYPYDLNVPPPAGRRDVVDYFLFDATRGFCTHYASAMSVMLRTVGVPARVATGYAMGDFSQEKQAFRVPVSAAHAWVEVYFPGYGWIEFEPTAYRTPFEYPEEGPLKEAQPAVPPIQKPGPKQAQPYFLALVALGALALLALPFMLLRLFTPSRQGPAAQASLLYRRMRRALAWAGLPALNSVTPDEYLLLYNDRLEHYTHLSGALRQATSVYRETIYSAHPPDARRVRAASIQWQQSLRDWVLLWVRTTWQKARSKNVE